MKSSPSPFKGKGIKGMGLQLITMLCQIAMKSRGKDLYYLYWLANLSRRFISGSISFSIQVVASSINGLRVPE